MRNFPLKIIFILLVFSGWIYSKEVHIVVLGSSTAAGIGPENSEQGWVKLYQDYLSGKIDIPIKVTNLAQKGYSTYNVLPTDYDSPKGRPNPNPEHNITQALNMNPSAIIINLPSNDAGKGYSVEEQLNNYQVILEKARRGGVPVWLTTTQPRNFEFSSRENLLEMRDSTLSLYGDMVIDFWEDVAMSNGFIHPVFDSGDGIHLNKWGHWLLMEKVRKAGILESLIN